MTDQSMVKLGSSTDPYNDAEKRGWDIRDASTLTAPLVLETDVVIVGTGAGGGGVSYPGGAAVSSVAGRAGGDSTAGSAGCDSAVFQ